jgi:hypothetical protein
LSQTKTEAALKEYGEFSTNAEELEQIGSISDLWKQTKKRVFGIFTRF